MSCSEIIFFLVIDYLLRSSHKKHGVLLIQGLQEGAKEFQLNILRDSVLFKVKHLGKSLMILE